MKFIAKVLMGFAYVLVGLILLGIAYKSLGALGLLLGVVIILLSAIVWQRL